MLRVYGYGDDNVCWESGKNWEFVDEVGCFNEDVVITFSDATVIRVGYSKKELGVWWIDVDNVGSAQYKLEKCFDENADIYSDIFYIDAKVLSAVPTSRNRYPFGKDEEPELWEEI